MSVDKDNVIQSFGWFKQLMDDDLDAKLAGLSYTLPTATQHDLGGVKVGYGLAMDANDRLNVTISDGDKNVIEAISVDGTTVQPDASKTVNLNLSATYAKKSEVASGVRMKGSVDFFSDLANLPGIPAVGDLYNIKTAGGNDGDGTPILAGDNVVYTDKGTWDVMAGFVDTSRFVEKVAGKQLSSNDFTNADKAKLDSLSNTTYTLPTASTTTKGGVKVGAGLSMAGDTLNCTVAGGGGTYNDFTGATSIVVGASGLVPAPAAGANEKFLCGNGKWEDIGKHVSIVNTGGSAGIVLGKDPTAVQGALWMDFINGQAVLKLRHDDYEYNFFPDSSNYSGSNLPALDTSGKGQIYILDTIPATTNGGLWYELDNGRPKLGLHYGNNLIFDYFYYYNSITYKGGAKNLISYIPCDTLPLMDCIIDSTYLKAVRNTDMQIATGTSLYGRAVTSSSTSDYIRLSIVGATTKVIDFWFTLLPSATSMPSGSYFIGGPDNVLRPKKINNTWCMSVGYSDTDYYTFSSLIGTPHHFAVLVNQSSNNKYQIAIDGKIHAHNFNIMNGAGDFYIYLAPYWAINKIRIFDTLIWDGTTDIDVPTLDDYT